MGKRFSELEKRLIAELQGDFPDSLHPYRDIAKKLGVTELWVLQKIQGFIGKGYIRRIGAILYHRQIGFKSNAMVVWKVPKNQVNKVGKIMASFPEVSHCYERVTHRNWRYNLYTMIHGKTKQDCRRIVHQISRKTGVSDYLLLYSAREFKKQSMQYF
jgi:DNA-binding Lrp family transcriptional regulator